MLLERKIIENIIGDCSLNNAAEMAYLNHVHGKKTIVFVDCISGEIKTGETVPEKSIILFDLKPENDLLTEVNEGYVELLEDKSEFKFETEEDIKRAASIAADLITLYNDRYSREDIQNQLDSIYGKVLDEKFYIDFSWVDFEEKSFGGFTEIGTLEELKKRAVEITKMAIKNEYGIEDMTDDQEKLLKTRSGMCIKVNGRILKDVFKKEITGEYECVTTINKVDVEPIDYVLGRW